MAAMNDQEWAYSWIRFSSDPQADGDSVARQERLRDAWMKRHPTVRLDNSLRSPTKGMSALRGKQRTDPKSDLTHFLERVADGLVCPGSYLIVENLDRLTRENPIDSIPFLLSLIKAGIRIVQLAPFEMVYDSNMEQHQLMMMLFELSRGHGESSRKSGMVFSAWEEKKKAAREGKPFGKQVAEWLELSDGAYRVREEAGKAIRLIFKWTIEGEGSHLITRRLQEDGIPAFTRSGKWARSYVAKILHDKTVIGEYQPRRCDTGRGPDGEPIPNYFPPVVSEAVFYAAQSAMKGRSGRSGRYSGDPDFWFPFSGILWDASSQRKMRIVCRNRKHYVINASAAELETCGEHRPFPAIAFRDGLLSQMEELKSSELFTDASGGKIGELSGRLDDVEKRLAAAIKAFDADPESQTWSAQVSKYDREKRSLVKELNEARAEASNPLPSIWESALAAIVAKNPGKLRAAILQTVESVWCVFAKVGFNRAAIVQVFFEGGATRVYAILWERMVTLKGRQRPDKWSVRSIASGPDERVIDLRKIKDAKKVERWLTAEQI